MQDCGPENDAACLSEARQHFSKAAAGPQGCASTLAYLLLAESEALGSHKKREERMERYLQQVIQTLLSSCPVQLTL